MECCRGSGDRAGTAARLGVFAEPPQPEEVHPGAARPRPDRHPGREPGHDLESPGRTFTGWRRASSRNPSPRPAGVAAVGLRRRHLRTITQPQVPRGRDRREEGQARAADDVQPAPGAAPAAGGHDPVRRGRGPEPDHRPQPRRIRALDLRRRTVLVVHARRDARCELPQPRSGARLGRVLLPERPERQARLVPRPRARHHSAERLRRPGQRIRAAGRPSSNASSTPASVPSREIPLVVQDKSFVDGTRPELHWGIRETSGIPTCTRSTTVPPGAGPTDPTKIRPGPSPDRCRTLGDSGVLRGHDGGERGSLSVPGGAAAPLPVPGAQRLAGALPQPAALLCGRLGKGGGPAAPRTGDGPDRHRGRVPSLPGAPQPSSRADRVRRERERKPVHACSSRPAERADVLIDFTRVPVGARAHAVQRRARAVPGRRPAQRLLHRRSDQTATGGAPSTPPGFGPNTRTLLQIRVVPRVGSPDPRTLDIIPSLAVAGSALAEHFDAQTGAPADASIASGMFPPDPDLPPAGRGARPQPHLERGLRRAGPARPAAGNGRAGRARTTRACPPGAATTTIRRPRSRQAGHGRGLEDLQPDRRHPPDPLPPGQRPGALAPAVRRRRPANGTPTLHGPGASPRTPTSSAGRRRCG